MIFPLREENGGQPSHILGLVDGYVAEEKREDQHVDVAGDKT